MTRPKFLLSSFAALLVLAGARNAVAGECHNQRNMAKALHSLEKARKDLEVAEHDKGGWRSRALQKVDEAIVETQKGCEFANERR
jgi:hypothetical protein